MRLKAYASGRTPCPGRAKRSKGSPTREAPFTGRALRGLLSLRCVKTHLAPYWLRVNGLFMASSPHRVILAAPALLGRANPLGPFQAQNTTARLQEL